MGLRTRFVSHERSGTSQPMQKLGSFYMARPGVTPPLLIVTSILLLHVGLKRCKNSLNIIQQRHICKVVIVTRSTCAISLNSLPTVRPSSAVLRPAKATHRPIKEVSGGSQAWRAHML